MSKQNVQTSGGGYYDPWRHAHALGLQIVVQPFEDQDPDSG